MNYIHHFTHIYYGLLFPHFRIDRFACSGQAKVTLIGLPHFFHDREIGGEGGDGHFSRIKNKNSHLAFTFIYLFSAVSRENGKIFHPFFFPPLTSSEWFFFLSFRGGATIMSAIIYLGNLFQLHIGWRCEHSKSALRIGCIN